MMRASLVLFFAFVSQLVFAHDLDLSLIKINRGANGTTIQVTTALSRLVRTAGLGPQPSGAALDVAVRERLQFRSTVPAKLEINSQADTLTWSVEAVNESDFRPRRFDESSDSAQTIVATYANGKLESEVVLKASEPVPTPAGILATGVAHILTGLDHVLFVVGIALLGGNWKSRLRLLTAFTVAHSLTLVAAATGVIQGNPRIVEPLIALSIVALAVEGMHSKQSIDGGNELLRLGIIFGFGLVHGFGFAGGLTELGLKGGQLLGNLFSFSVGIELGQVAVLVPTLAALALIAKAAKDRAQQFTLASTVGLGMIGCFWFVERVL